MGTPTPSWAHTANGEFWKFAVHLPSFFNNSTLLRRVLILERRNFYPGTANFQLATSIFSSLDVEFFPLRRRFFKAETSRFLSKNVEISLWERRTFSSVTSNFLFGNVELFLFRNVELSLQERRIFLFRNVKLTLQERQYYRISSNLLREI